MALHESVAAIEASERSLQEAENALNEAQEKLHLSQPIKEAIKAHNDTNHYDAWLRKLLEGSHV